jgi:hypothetical protein
MIEKIIIEHAKQCNSLFALRNAVVALEFDQNKPMGGQPTRKQLTPFVGLFSAVIERISEILGAWQERRIYTMTFERAKILCTAYKVSAGAYGRSEKILKNFKDNHMH